MRAVAGCAPVGLLISSGFFTIAGKDTEKCRSVYEKRKDRNRSPRADV